jgi:hypothetical protein
VYPFDNLPEHPARVYGGSPDLALAYTGPLDGITARAVVWPDRLRYGRTYGHTSLIERLLKNAGYSHGYLDGAKVRAVPCDRGFVMPYVDNTSRGELSADRQWITLGDGSIDVQNTTGIATFSDSTCDHCGEPCDDDESLCGYCMDHTSSCEACGERVSDDETWAGPSGDAYYCQSCYEDRFTTCDACHETIATDDGRTVGRHTYCDECWCERYFTCDHCGDDASNDDLHSSEVTGDSYCSGCWEDHDRTCEIDGCETEWNELDAFGYSDREARKRARTGDLCDACASRYCHTCESTHDPDNCPVIADAESDGFGVASWDPTGTPWQGGLRFDQAPPAIVQVPGLPIGYACDWRHYGTIGAARAHDPAPCYDRVYQPMLAVPGPIAGYRTILSDMQ